MAALTAVTAAAPAHAGRGLDEPPSLAKAAKAPAKADLERAVKAGGLTDVCTSAALGDAFLVGIECRGVVAAFLALEKPISTGADLDARAALFADLAKAAASVASFDPLTPPPGLARLRFDAHRALTKALVAMYDDVTHATPASTGVAQADLERAADAMKRGACNSASSTYDLAGRADASVEERGAAQAVLTSHACFLDEKKLATEPKPTAIDTAQPAAAAATEAGAILSYAQSRQIDLRRCVDKHVSATLKVDDDAKLADCLCKVTQRWRFPKPRDIVAVKLPLLESDRLGFLVHIGPDGSVEKCVRVTHGARP